MSVCLTGVVDGMKGVKLKWCYCVCGKEEEAQKHRLSECMDAEVTRAIKASVVKGFWLLKEGDPRHLFLYI